jgi:hypothetical protein
MGRLGVSPEIPRCHQPPLPVSASILLWCPAGQVLGLDSSTAAGLPTQAKIRENNFEAKKTHEGGVIELGGWQGKAGVQFSGVGLQAWRPRLSLMHDTPVSTGHRAPAFRIGLPPTPRLLSSLLG